MMTSAEQWLLRVGLEFGSEIERRDLEQVAGMLEDELAGLDAKVMVSIAPETFDPAASGPIVLLAATMSGPMTEAARHMAPKLLSVIRGWLAKDRRRHVKVRVGNRVLEVADASPEEQRQLVTAFVAAIESDLKA
jgi:hypothetical protein